MAYTKTTLISRPIEHSYNGFGDTWDAIKGGVSSAVDFFGSALKAQGAASALQAQATAQAQAQAAAQQQQGGGISTTHLLIGGAALAAVLVLAMRR